MRKKLIVIGEPEILSSNGTRNNALNEILQNYKNYSIGVFYLGPSGGFDIDSYSCNGVQYEAISSYSKRSRLVVKECFSIIKKVKKIISSYQDYHIQFRIPSLFSLQVYWILKGEIDLSRVSFYVAGDWKESIAFNYPRKKYLNFLPFLQDLTLRGKKCVFTGHTLLNKNKKIINKGHAFYSTTHKLEDIVSSDIVLRDERKAICFIGRLENLKNPEFMLRLAASENMRKSYFFYIIGNGPLLDFMKNKIIDLGIDNVKLTGHINDREKFYNIISLCKYYILPSYTEGTPKTLPEMMSQGVLPVAFDNVGSNNYIVENRGGLVDIDSVNQVVDFINRCDEDFGFYKDRVNSCLDYAKDHSIEKEMELMFSFLYNN